MSIRELARRFIGNKTYIIALVVIAVATHIAWFVPGSVLFHTDWLHWTDKAASQAWYSLGTWSNYFGFGQSRIQIGFTVFQDLWALFVNLGTSFDTAVKFTLMVPIALLGFLSPYFAMRRLGNDNFIAFVAALFYGSTTYFLLKQGSHLPIALVYALAPMILMLFVRAYDTMRGKDWVVFALVYSLGLWSEVRIMYIVSCVLALYMVVFFPNLEKLKKIPKSLLIVVPLLFALNAFWIIPTATGSATTVIAQTTGRALFGNFLFDLAHSLTLSSASWTGGVPDESFIMQPVPLYLWLLPLVILLPFALKVKLTKEKQRLAFLFAILAVAGIFLTKQAVAPLPDAYGWLYAHFPGFSLFREASKLYLLSAIGYMGLLVIGLLAIKKRRFFVVVAAVPIIAAGMNMWPLLSGGFDTLFTARHELPGYAQVNEKIKTTNDMTRSLWLPLDSQWAYFDATHPKVGAAGVVSQEWAPFVKAGPFVHDQLANLFSKGLAQNLAQAASVKYVIVPARDITNEDDFYRYYGDDRQFYVDMLNSVPWLKHIETGAPNIDVYENTQARPYIDTSDTLVALPSFDDIETQREFVQANNIVPTFNFAPSDQEQVKHSTQMRDMFSGLEAANVKSGTVTSSVTLSGNAPMLYLNTNRPSVSYHVQNGTLDLKITQPGQINVNGQTVTTQTPSTTMSTKLNAGLIYFTAVGEHVDPIDVVQTAERNIGNVSDDFRIVATDTTNLVPNPSFEQGLWQPQIKDCNAYDDNARIGIELNDAQHSDGGHSLRLNAANHTACTDSPAVPVNAGSDYLLQFDFRGEDADQLKYNLIFNDPAQTVIKKSDEVKDKSWHTLRQPIRVPNGATTMTVELMVVPHQLKRYSNATIYFDNVRVGPFVTALDPKLDTSPHYQTVSLQSGQNQVEYVDPSYNGQNLIPNPSLESGLWQKAPGDCNSYDKNPDLTMSIAHSASDGSRSLELGARRHTACTGPGAVPIKEGATYLLSFDHQSPNTKATQYHVGFDDPNNEGTFTGDVPVSNKWQTTTRTIKAPIGAHTMQVSVYANAPNEGSSYTRVRYDNFKLIEIPDIQNQYFAVSKSGDALTKPRETTFTNVLSTKKLVHVKGASDSFFLSMSESYDPKWRLEINNEKVNGALASWWPFARPDVVAADDHVKWDGFTNGWYVDTKKLCDAGHCSQNSDGTYDIELMAEFTPERWFDIGVWVSVMSFAGCVVYLLARWLIDHRRPKPMLPPDGANPAELFVKGQPQKPRPAPPLRVPPRKPKQPPKKPRLIQL